MKIFLKKVKKKSSNDLGYLENFIWSETMHYITHSDSLKKTDGEHLQNENKTF